MGGHARFILVLGGAYIEVYSINKVLPRYHSTAVLLLEHVTASEHVDMLRGSDMQHDSMLLGRQGKVAKECPPCSASRVTLGARVRCK